MPIHDTIARGDGDALRRELAMGADPDEPGRGGTTPLMTAIEHRSLACMAILLDAGADPERTDDGNHTALRVAVQHDWLPGVDLLLARGVDPGRDPKHPLERISFDAATILGDVPMPAGLDALMSQEEWRQSLTQTMRSIDEKSADRRPDPVIADARSVPVLQRLLDAGEDLADADAELRRRYIGLGTGQELVVGRDDFARDRHPRFGDANPQPVRSPFWEAMIRCGANAYVARQRFGHHDLGRPIWCYDRFGHSLTRLHDGRFIGIGGEHEDHYDPDFAIYNDVVVHDGHGGIRIFAYPRDVFPPTDFHTATLVDDGILIIGNLGYPGDRRPGTTPILRLDLGSFAIEPLVATGAGPGWISRHRSVFDAATRTISITGGQVWTAGADGEGRLVPFTGRAVLSVPELRWVACGPA